MPRQQEQKLLVVCPLTEEIGDDTGSSTVCDNGLIKGRQRSTMNVKRRGMLLQCTDLGVSLWAQICVLVKIVNYRKIGNFHRDGIWGAFQEPTAVMRTRYEQTTEPNNSPGIQRGCVV